MKPENLKPWTIHIKHLSDREVDKKTVSKSYQNSFCIKVVVLNRSYSRTSTNSSAVTWSRDTAGGTWQQFCTAIGGRSGDVIRTIQTIRNNIINYIYQKC